MSFKYVFDIKKTHRTRFSLFAALISLSTLLFIISDNAFAGLTVYDNVAPSEKNIKLTALTKGRFFPAGGRLVKFYVNGRHIGTALSGGDGYAFLKYLSHSSGIKKLKVEAGDETDEGILLITGKNEAVILIEIENSLLGSIFYLKPAKDAPEILGQLQKKFRIIYLTTLTGVKLSRKWLNDNKFPQSAVIKWKGKDMLDDLKAQGLELHAIIGSPDIISEAVGIKKRFSFTETENGITVKGWKDISEQLK